MREFDGRIAIVTGASSGIGRATAELLARRGARVAIFARSKRKLTSFASNYPGRILGVAGDVSAEDDLNRLFDTVEDHFGPCDVLVNNAGMIDAAHVVEMSAEQADRIFAVNMRSVFLASRRALPNMIERGRGCIVNVASISGVAGPEKFPGFAVYNASKAAVVAFTEGLAVEVKEHGIRVNCVSPGSVDTKMWNEVSGGAPAAMKPEEVAETILFLASERSRPINGQNLHVYSA